MPRRKRTVFAVYAILPGDEEPAFRLLSLCVGCVPISHWRTRSQQMPAVLDVTSNTERGWCIRNNITGRFTARIMEEGIKDDAIIDVFD